MPLPDDSMFFGLELTDEQRIFCDSIFDNQMTIVNAKAGTGKTTLAVGCARMLEQDLIYIVAPVEEGRMGYRPGNQEAKERPYLTPLYDALEKINENPIQVIFSEDTNSKGKNNSVWVYPMSHIFTRGINFENKTIIIDECQNFTKSELKKLLTRIHDNCTVILIGHTGQIDLQRPTSSGFADVIEHFRYEDYAQVCNLTHNFRGRLSRHADLL